MTSKLFGGRFYQGIAFIADETPTSKDVVLAFGTEKTAELTAHGALKHGDGRTSATGIAKRFAGAGPPPQAPRRAALVRDHRAGGCGSLYPDCRSG
jgi:hypothetical protein